jgi:N-acetylglutamate synthase-like GNAT family acetyltransferase
MKAARTLEERDIRSIIVQRFEVQPLDLESLRGYMAQRQEITVRRAKVRDASTIAAFVNRAWRGREAVGESAVIERFGSVGFLLAEQDGDLVGMLGWQVENLVVRLTDFLVMLASDHAAVGQALLSEMERAANELQCEIVLLFLPRPAPAALAAFCEGLGYESRVVGDLPRVWRDAAHEGGLEDEETVWMKQLRDTRVVSPL